MRNYFKPFTNLENLRSAVAFCFNIFSTEKFNRRTNVAFATNGCVYGKAETLLLGLFSVSWRSEQLKTFLSKLVEEFDNGEVSWNTRDDADNMLKSF